MRVCLLSAALDSPTPGGASRTSTCTPVTVACIQMTTPVTESLGARYIPRDAFLARLKETRERGLVLFDPVPSAPLPPL